MDAQIPLHYDNEKIKGELIALLKTNLAILMVGSGSSSIVGYPGWKKLVRDMKNTLYPDLPDPTDDTDLLRYAHTIKDKAIKTQDTEKKYYKFLRETFRHQDDGENYHLFHCSLVKLGFSGMVTTNYDHVLELATQAAYARPLYCPKCEPIDLCEGKPYTIFRFLRSLKPDTKHSYILHLHGDYVHPETIILTSNDYLEKYGLLKDEEEIAIPLDTIHRKVIWALITLHPLVFVGFSLTDKYFLKMIETVQSDFELEQKEHNHYAIMGYSNDEDKLKTINELSRLGICPIFYKIINNFGGAQDHRGLVDLIFEFENTLTQQNKVQLQPAEEGESKLSKKTDTGSEDFPKLDDMNKISGG